LAGLLACWLAGAFTLPWALVTGRAPQPLGVASGLHPRRHAALVGRRFFQNTWVDPGYWQKQVFVCEAFMSILPKPKKKAKLRVLEIEPVDGKFLSYLKPNDPDWYVEEYVAIGQNMWEFESDQINSIKREALALGAAPRFQSWTGTQKWKLLNGCVDMALLADGSITRLGKLQEAALMEIKRVLKPDGRLYFVTNEDDEQRLGGRFELGLQGSLLAKAGFELIAAKRSDFGLTAGYLRKKQLSRKGKKQLNPLRNIPRPY